MTSPLGAHQSTDIARCRKFLESKQWFSCIVFIDFLYYEKVVKNTTTFTKPIYN